MNSQFSQPPPYIGRFAPSPTGPLHFGSLVTALASFLDARANKGKWLVRIEDIDPPREQPGADKLILETLETHGLEWDSSVLYQSSRLAAYEDIIDFLFDQGQVYCCDCSRQQLKNHPIYPGTCRHRRLKRRDNFAVRIMVPPQRIQFDDEIQGVQAQQMEQEVGDFVVFRRDGLVAYQLAVATDDAFQHISKVVRGQDLLSSTSRQCYLFKTLSINPPEYAHVPIITNIQGQKLSKQNLAQPLNPRDRLSNLYTALSVLGQRPPKELIEADLASILNWGINHWSMAQIPRETQIPQSSIIHSNMIKTPYITK